MKKIVKLFYVPIKSVVRLCDIVFNYVTLKLNGVTYVSFPKIHGRILVRNYGRIHMGGNVVVNSGKKSNIIGQGHRTAFCVGKGAELSIGDGVGISNSCVVCKKKVTIGDNVYIGGSCRIYDTDFHSIDIKDRISRPDPGVKCKDILIESGVFIGASSIILKGVVLGSNAVIGAGSVVSRSVPNNQVWAGNPIEYIRTIE